MKNFVIQLTKFLSIPLTLFIVIILILKPTGKPEADYMLAMVDKHKRADSITEPKIILAGGSNVAFGINSELIENKFSLPVVNLAIHAALGVDYIIAELENTIKQNDIVLISFEYFLESEGDYVLKKHVSDIYPKSSEYFETKITSEIGLVFDIVRNRIKKILKSPSENNNNLLENRIYSSTAFNKHGDFVAHLDMNYFEDLGGKGVLKYHYWDGIDKINNFAKIAKRKNVEVFYFFPAYPRSEFMKNRIAVMKNYGDLLNDLMIELVGNPKDFVYDNDCFYNTIYHLNGKGRLERTIKLIDLLNDNKNFRYALARKVVK